MPVRVVAEIGQNHNGSPELAAALIDMAADPRPHDLKEAEPVRCDAVKFTVRDNLREGSRQFMGRDYGGRNSFGRTYAEHRDRLELPRGTLMNLAEHARKKGLGVVVTVCQPSACWAVQMLKPIAIKIASRDLTNLPLLEAVAETQMPVILSTGMANRRDLDDAIDVFEHDHITIMHCVSTYPAPWDALNLHSITWLKHHYSFPIGYSDHSEGIVAPVAAVAMGAVMVEKHITIDRTLRGTDHRASLERDGLYRMLRDIRHTEAAMGRSAFFRDPTTEAARTKLARSLATARDMSAGEVITEKDLHLLSPGTGFLWRHRALVVGQTLAVDLPADTILDADHLALNPKAA